MRRLTTARRAGKRGSVLGWKNAVILNGVSPWKDGGETQ